VKTSRLVSRRGGFRRLIGATIAMGGLVGAGAEAQASSILTVGAARGLDNLETITATYDGWGNQPQSFLAGTLTGSINGGTSFDTYCVDLNDVVFLSGKNGTSSFAVNALPITSLTGGNGAGVGFLYDQFATTIADEANGASKNIDGAALQVAIWKVEYDNGGPLSSGHFQMADSSNRYSIQHEVFAQATSYLSAYNGSQAGDATWYEAVSHPVVSGVTTNQNMIGPATISTQGIPTPEPSSIVMAGVGMIAVLAYARRTRRLTGAAEPVPAALT
jgi:hypothetical protein